jgi:hypothetical protein
MAWVKKLVVGGIDSDAQRRLEYAVASAVSEMSYDDAYIFFVEILRVPFYTFQRYIEPMLNRATRLPTWKITENLLDLTVPIETLLLVPQLRVVDQWAETKATFSNKASIDEIQDWVEENQDEGGYAEGESSRIVDGLKKAAAIIRILVK